MDWDIFERKIKLKGYYMPKLNETTRIIYKQVTFDDSDYCIESTDLLKKVVTINISRFIQNADSKNWIEEPVVSIDCKNYKDFFEIIDNIAKLETKSSSEPFSSILKESNMKFVKRKSKWIRI